jgi:hypothetical protein
MVREQHAQFFGSSRAGSRRIMLPGLKHLDDLFGDGFGDWSARSVY